MTIERILEEKRTFDLSLGLEKVGIDEDNRGWSLPGTLSLTFIVCQDTGFLLISEYSSFSTNPGLHLTICYESSPCFH